MTIAMKIGSLDLLSVIPQDEVVKYGIPYLRSVLEAGKEQLTLALWDKFLVYFDKTWMLIIESWNICIGNDKYIEMVNHTNNSLERYNWKFNGLFPKRPSLIEFVQILEVESCAQADHRAQINSGKEVEVERPEPTIPKIPAAYRQYKSKVDKDKAAQEKQKKQWKSQRKQK